MWFEDWFSVSLRSWSSQTSSQCFTVFTLFSLPKLLAWTRCLWRAKAPRPPLGSLLFPVSPVIHRHLSWNTPLDRCCFHWPLLKKDAALNHECGLCRWWTGDLEHVQTRTLWGAAVRTAGIKDLFVRDYLTCLQISQISGTTVGWNFTERLNGHIRCDSKGFFLNVILSQTSL